MAIQYVGGVATGRNGNTNATTTQSLSGTLTGGLATSPAEGDLVIVCCAAGSQGRNAAQAISGYSTLGTQLNASAVTYDTSMQVSYKRMTSTPDTSITIPAQGDAADGQSWAVMVFRGVDATTPFDVSSVSATGTGTGRPNPAAITPTTAGAWIVVAAAAAASATTTAFTFPTDLSDDAVQGTGADTNDSRASLAYHDGWTSGEYNPAAYTGGTTGTNDSWAAWTMALRPAPAPYTLDVTQAGITPSGKVVNAEKTVEADPAQLEPAGQAIALILSTVMAVTAASVTPSTKAVELDATYSVPVTAAAITPATQDVTLDYGASYTLPVTQAGITPSTQDVTLSYTAGATLPVTAAGVTPSGKVVNAELTRSADPAQIEPAGQTLTLSYTTGYRVQVTAAGITPATQALTLDYAASYQLPVTAAAVTPSTKDVTLTATGLSDFTLDVVRAAMQPAGQTIWAELTRKASPAQIEPATQTLDLIRTQYRLEVVAAALTPSGKDVDYQDERQFAQCQIIPAGQDVVLSAARRVDVTRASVTPAPQQATLRTRMPVVRVEMTPTRGTAATAHVWPFTAASVTPAGQALTLDWSDNPDMTVEPASVTPSGKAIVLRTTLAMSQAAVQPAGQALTTNWRGPVTRANVQPASVGMRLRMALTANGTAIQAQPKDIELRYLGPNVMPVLAATVSPQSQTVVMYGGGLVIASDRRVIDVKAEVRTEEPGGTSRTIRVSRHSRTLV